MKKRLYLPLVLLMGALFIGGCIKSEAPNAEADILSCTLDEAILRAEPTVINDAVMVLVSRAKGSLEALAPKFEITPGATIVPESGTVRNFSDEATGQSTGGKNTHLYTVTSEDGKWSKEYKVTVTDKDFSTFFALDHWYLNQSETYENPYQPVFIDDNGNNGPADEHIQLKIWSSGNAGYAIVGGDNPSDFPTSKSTDSQSGKYAAKLETKLTGYKPLPLAAGNLFLGSFDAATAMAKPLEATRFGVPFDRKPLRLSGHYKYKSGPVYKEYDKEAGTVIDVKDKRDSCSLYAVLYYKDMPGSTDVGFGEEDNRLHGGNALISDRLIALAALDTDEIGEYTFFDIEFEYNKKGYIKFDEELSAQYKYYFAIVCSASSDGGRFSGAPGSIMHVDNLRVKTSEDK